VVRAGGPLEGSIRLPGDKSISHRALIFNAIACGRSRISGLLSAEDVRSTARCLGALGVSLGEDWVEGASGALSAPAGILDCGNSGTTLRLLLGVLAGQPFTAHLTGDASLRRRPMGRVIDPLTGMGAQFESSQGTPPVTVQGGPLQAGHIVSAVASAQVKSAVLLAGLQSTGELVFTEPRRSRDHTERMLAAMGVTLHTEVAADGRHTVRMSGSQALHCIDVDVPGDLSSAAFLLVAATIVPGSSICLEGVGLNPTRTGTLDVLRRMGADIGQVESGQASGEPIGTLRVLSAPLHGTEIGGAEIPRLIDELPVLAVAAALAAGETRIRDAAELRVKESDRISATVAFLRAMGCEVDETEDGMVIEGLGEGASLAPARVDASGDHRIAMAAAVAGLRGRGETVVDGADAIATSFPEFPGILESLRA